MNEHKLQSGQSKGKVAELSFPKSVTATVAKNSGEPVGYTLPVAETSKLMRRYSIDDNGGGYLGL